MLSGLVKRGFRGFFEVLLWIILVSCVIGGVVGGNLMGGRYSAGHPILGGVIGLVGGLLFIIICGGFIGTILNMDENLEEIREKINRSGAGLGNAPSTSPRKCKKCGKSFDGGYSGCPHCGSPDFE